MFINIGRKGLSAFNLNPALETRRMSYVAITALCVMSIVQAAIIFVA
ncbi:hypothetical protein [Salidesulfovibrio brasiliensis]|nr:hypothetical protein [Salidesulfovibrio brasiliensis]